MARRAQRTEVGQIVRQVSRMKTLKSSPSWNKASFLATKDESRWYGIHLKESIRDNRNDVRCFGAFVGPLTAEKGGQFGHATSPGGSSCGAAGLESAFQIGGSPGVATP